MEEDASSHFIADILEITPIFLSYLWNEHPRIDLFLHVYDVFDEMLNIEEGSQIWVVVTHCQKLLSLNYQELKFGNYAQKIADLAWIWGLDASNGFLWSVQQIIDVFFINLQCASLNLLRQPLW